MHDVLIVQEASTKQKYVIDDSSIKNTNFKNSWIVLGYRSGIEDRFFFLESASEIRELHTITEHLLLQTPLHRTELKDLRQRLENIFVQNKAFTLSEYLQKLEI